MTAKGRPVTRLHDPFSRNAPPKALCHPGAHDAIDMWDGQCEAILGELALHGKNEDLSPGALIGKGLKQTGRHVPGHHRQAPDA